MKIGYKVLIKENTRYYNRNQISNPSNVVGIIVRITGPVIVVNWGKDPYSNRAITNTYRKDDLKLLHNKQIFNYIL